MVYGLSGCARQFLFLVMSLLGSQFLPLRVPPHFRLTAHCRHPARMANITGLWLTQENGAGVRTSGIGAAALRHGPVSHLLRTGVRFWLTADSLGRLPLEVEAKRIGQLTEIPPARGSQPEFQIVDEARPRRRKLRAAQRMAIRVRNGRPSVGEDISEFHGAAGREVLAGSNSAVCPSRSASRSTELWRVAWY